MCKNRRTKSMLTHESIIKCLDDAKERSLQFFRTRSLSVHQKIELLLFFLLIECKIKLII